MPFRNFISAVRMYTHIYDMKLLWQLYAMKSSWMISCMKMEDASGAVGDCVCQVLICQHRHVFRMLPVEIYISKMFSTNSVSTRLISWSLLLLLSVYFQTSVMWFPTYVTSKEMWMFMFAGPRSYFTGSTAGARVASHYIAVGWTVARDTGAASCRDL